MRNNLFINRLLIYTNDGKVAYDEQFHKGVNIIRGDNSSGKSTITHFIFYVLGGDFIDFVPQVLDCSVVYAEIEANGVIVTIKREIETKLEEENEVFKSELPIFFYWGKLDESLAPPPENNWLKFGYRTLPTKKSFSNVLFELLDIPIVKEEGSNITFHQLLRLIYIDQESPTSSLFLYELFDSQIKRETVADLLLGVYNQELYDKKKRKIEAEKELDNLKREITATERFFNDPLTLNPSHIKSAIDNKQNDIAKINDLISALNATEQSESLDDGSKLEFEIVNKQAIDQRKVVIDLEQKIEKLELEIEDSKYFLETLAKKIHALRNSIQTREFLGNLPIEFCPECLQPIRHTDDLTKCKLCKEDIDPGFGVTQATKMEQEISFQIKESQSLLAIKERRLMEFTASYNSEKVKLSILQTQVNSSYKNVRSRQEENRNNFYRDKGFIEGEILQFRTLLEQAELYQQLIKLKESLETELKGLGRFIYLTETAQTETKKDVYKKIEEEGVYLLNNDSLKQDEFKHAQDFYIDFRNNIAFLSNKYEKYSASSNFYLKIAARFAIFLASLSMEKMRYPRLIIADNMEDKGIQENRAQNLQKIIIERLQKFDVNSYQVIYTTSYITQELNESNYCVGPFYTQASPSLKNVRESRTV
jgi:BMFP domain-containing protein YqiC